MVWKQSSLLYGGCLWECWLYSQGWVEKSVRGCLAWLSMALQVAPQSPDPECWAGMLRRVGQKNTAELHTATPLSAQCT